MHTVRYIKSFSKGQITIPKEFRDMVGIGDEFWLKLSVQDGKFIAEPVEQEQTAEDYAQKLLTIDTDWFCEEDYKAIREEVEERMKRLGI